MAKTLGSPEYKARIDVTDRNGHRFEMFNISARSSVEALAQRKEIYDRVNKKYDPKEIFIFTNWNE